MRTDGIKGHFVFVAVAVVLASCATSPAPAPVSDTEDSLLSASKTPIERRLVGQAHALMKRESWAEAAERWEALQLLRPDVPEYGAQLKESQSRAKRTASRDLDAAAAARERNEFDQALVAYLKALNMDPGNKEAMRGAREIEQERVERSLANKAARAAAAPARGRGQATAKAQPRAYETSRQDLEQGIARYREGNYPASIRELEGHLQADPQDEEGRRYLADAYAQLARQQQRSGKKEQALASLEKAQSLKSEKSDELDGPIRSLRNKLADEYYQKGVRAYFTDIGKAIASWERALQFNPDHRQSRLRLDQARKVQQNLRTINGSR